MSAHSQNGRPGNGHLNDETMLRYQEHRLAVDELRAADRHMISCGNCRRVLLSRMGPVPLPDEISDLPEPLHLSYEQITSYIDNQLSAPEKDRVDAHLFLCASCNREIEGLRKLDLQLAAPVASTVPVPEPAVPFSRRIAQFFAMPGRAREFGVAFGALIIGILLFQAGNGNAGSSPVTAILRLGAESHAGLHLGGYVLVVAGIAYAAYSLLRKR
jgi:hypothetical protein